MKIKVKDLIQTIEKFAPVHYQESYDNTGVQVGNVQQELTGVLVALDITPAVVDEAIRLGFNCIVAHHPLIFSGLKKITGKNDIDRCIIKAIKHDIVLYAAHTNLDAMWQGVNKVFADKLMLQNCRILSPSNMNELCKFVCYVPETHVAEVQEALFAAGGGHIGNYSECSFNSKGTGTFKPIESAAPKIGELNKRSYVAEQKVEVLATNQLTDKLLAAVRAVGYYEEVAYDIIPLLNQNQYIGAGYIGQLAAPMEEQTFLQYLKEKMDLPLIKYTPLQPGSSIQTVALCGGSGSFLFKSAMAQQADVFITADYKYHQFFEAEGRMMIADIGHFESEKYTIDLLIQIIQNQHPEQKIRATENNTNPVAYYY